MAVAYARVAMPLGMAVHGVYLVSFSAQSDGYRTERFRDPLSTSSRLWNKSKRMIFDLLTGCLLATAPLPKEGVKSKLFNCEDGSRESSHMFPVPYIFAALHSLDL